MTPRPVLFLVDTLAKGGLAHVVLTVAERLRARGHPTGIGVLDGNVDTRPSDAVWLACNPVSRAAQGSRMLRSRAARFGLATIAEFTERAGTPDLIIAAGELAIRCADAWQHPRIVFSSHSSQLGAPKHAGAIGDLRQAFKRLRRGHRLRRLLNGRHVHVVSSGLADELVEDFGVRPASLSVIGNPFDIEAIRHQSCEATPESAAQTGPFVVGVGELNARKDFGTLVRAFASSGLDGDLVLVGQGEEEEALRQLGSTLGLAQRLRIVPFHANHYALVRKAQALALTSRSEGFGNVLIEALILGVPAVSTDCPHGPRDILAPLDPRALVPPGNVELFAERLRDIVQRPYPIPDSAVGRYDIDRVVDRYLALASRFSTA
ncbi:MAG: glycosyltransferase [Burkholderiaceae bacterium]